MAVAQVVLTASESRKLIARAVSQLDEVRDALRYSKIVVCTGSISPDILEALGFGPIPEEERGLYICGMIRGEGLCTTDFDVVRSATFIEKGRLIEKPGREFMKNFGAGDVYIKSPNILDRNGVAGVLTGAPRGGRVAHMVFELRDRGFGIVAPTLLLKSAPIDVKDLTETVSQENFSRDASGFVSHSCGMPVNLVLLPKKTVVVTEIEAIKKLFGLTAKPIGMSGVGSGADAVALSAEGPEGDVRGFWEYVCSIKGSRPIMTHASDCGKCPDAQDPNRCGGYLRQS
jgi:hypothetical protein